MGQKNLTIAIIGLGRIGKIHLETAKSHSNVERILVCDPEITPDFINQNDKLQFFSNHKVLLESESGIDGVLLCSPTSYHFQMIADFAKHGIDIFCEKPLSLDVSEIILIKDIIDQHKVKLQVGFNRRYDPDFRKLQQRISGGDIGELHQLLITSRDPAPPPIEFVKDSGGLFFDMMIHDFDMARYLVGSEVKEVFATGDIKINEAIKEYHDIDTATVILRFKNGLICTVQNSRQAVYGYDQRIEAFGSEGMLKLNNRLEDRIELWNKNELQLAKPLYFFLERFIESYKAEVNQFIEHLMEDKLDEAGHYDALQATKIAIAATESLKTNRVISVN